MGLFGLIRMRWGVDTTPLPLPRGGDLPTCGLLRCCDQAGFLCWGVHSYGWSKTKRIRLLPSTSLGPSGPWNASTACVESTSELQSFRHSFGVSVRCLFFLETGEGSGKGDAWYAVTRCGAVTKRTFCAAKLGLCFVGSKCAETCCVSFVTCPSDRARRCVLCVGCIRVEFISRLWPVCSAWTCTCRMGLGRFSDFGCAVDRLIIPSCARVYILCWRIGVGFGNCRRIREDIFVCVKPLKLRSEAFRVLRLIDRILVIVIVAIA